jgi:hypothetical protein
MAAAALGRKVEAAPGVCLARGTNELSVPASGVICDSHQIRSNQRVPVT